MRYKKITSQSNPHVKEAFKIREKRTAFKQTAFIIEGLHLIEMALGSRVGCSTGSQIKKIFFTDTFSVRKEGRRLLQQISKYTSEIFEVTEKILSKLTDTEAPQGIIAVVSYTPLLIEELSLQDKPILVVIDGIQDPGNLGTILRTADAIGADAVILLPGTCDLFMPKTIRATAGSIFNIPITHAGITFFLEWLCGKRIQLAVTSSDAGRSIFDVDLRRPVAFVFGNEVHGVSKELKKSADLILRIPILGKAESLNVATSAAVCLYEAVRQRSLSLSYIS